MTLNRVTAVILRYFAKRDSFRSQLRWSNWSQTHYSATEM